MRELSKIEEDRLKLLSKNSISFALLEPTETALKKGIIDATGSVRKYLKECGIHDYENQGQGAKANGINVEANIYSATNVIKTSASLYRPKAKGKGGDPRIWFSGLPQNASPKDILVLICFDNGIQILNLTQLPLNEVINSQSKNPINELIAEISAHENKVSIELLNKLRAIASHGFVKSEVNSDTGIGRTLESLLGIEMNSSKSPDYKGIELKSFRNSRSTRKGLFAKTPDWELSKFKSRVEILDNFGYWEKGIFRLYNTIRATGRNAQGLILKVDYENDWLLENSDKPKIGDFLVWQIDSLRNALKEKHKETFWISAESKVIDNDEHFLFKMVEHTKNPMVDKFEMLLEIGAITLDYPIKRMPSGEVKDKGCNFKLKASCLDLLFPPSAKYSLLDN
jgi:hypothetical protein